MSGVLQDLGVAWRVLWKRPGFALVAILTLALGIGANTAIFSFVQGVLLEPLPYPESERLVTVWENHEARGGPASEWTGRASFVDWQAPEPELPRPDVEQQIDAAIDGWIEQNRLGGPEPARDRTIVHHAPRSARR